MTARHSTWIPRPTRVDIRGLPTQRDSVPEGPQDRWSKRPRRTAASNVVHQQNQILLVRGFGVQSLAGHPLCPGRSPLREGARCRLLAAELAATESKSRLNIRDGAAWSWPSGCAVPSASVHRRPRSASHQPNATPRGDEELAHHPGCKPRHGRASTGKADLRAWSSGAGGSVALSHWSAQGD